MNRIVPVELLLGLTARAFSPAGTLNIRRHPRRLSLRSSASSKAVARRHAPQFSLAQPASAAVIPGASRPERIAEDHAALKAVIPADFWREMRKQGLVAANAPLPIDR